MDLHGTNSGFFNIPFDNLLRPRFYWNISAVIFKDAKDLVMVSPDAGGVERACLRQTRKCIGCHDR